MLIGEKHDLKRSWDGKSYILSPPLADRSRCCCRCWCRVHLRQTGKEGDDFLLRRLFSLLRKMKRETERTVLSVEDLLRVRDVYQESLGGSRKSKYLNHKSISARLNFNGSNAIPMIFSDTHSVDSLRLWLIWLVRAGHRRRCRYQPASIKAGVIYVAICMRYSCTFVAMPPSNEPRPLTPISCPPLLPTTPFSPPSKQDTPRICNLTLGLIWGFRSKGGGKEKSRAETNCISAAF